MYEYVHNVLDFAVYANKLVKLVKTLSKLFPDKIIFFNFKL